MNVIAPSKMFMLSTESSTGSLQKPQVPRRAIPITSLAEVVGPCRQNRTWLVPAGDTPTARGWLVAAVASVNNEVSASQVPV
jgi:hypothetical protein